MKERDNKVSFECSLRDEGWSVVVVYNRATNKMHVTGIELPPRMAIARAALEAFIAYENYAPSPAGARRLARKIGDWLTSPANSVGPN